MQYRVERNEDPSVALALETAEGWPRSLSEVARRFAVHPPGHFVARAPDGRVLGAVSATVYPGADLAWISGMVVAPRARGAGVGRALLRHAVAHAEGEGARVIGLDATDAGRPLYESEGFREVDRTVRWERAEGAPRPDPGPSGDYAIYPVSACEIMDVHAFDRARFGASRAPWLAAVMADFPERAFVAFHRRSGAIAGLAFGQERAVGPLVADAPEAAAWLLLAVERAGTPPVARLLESNAAAARVFEAAGYVRSSRACCARMTRGGPLSGRSECVFAIGHGSTG